MNGSGDCSARPDAAWTSVVAKRLLVAAHYHNVNVWRCALEVVKVRTVGSIFPRDCSLHAFVWP